MPPSPLPQPITFTVWMGGKRRIENVKSWHFPVVGIGRKHITKRIYEGTGSSHGYLRATQGAIKPTK
ncbi:unnamed protein product [Dovyalis caffra]|uniref:Ribosomal protein S19 n=1 Tax=Dovyalis caffra TaxID=77055 RepID=A0AAV1SH70_9ROSI|nr:unnamed protein product [Dovyalis caffra]